MAKKRYDPATINLERGTYPKNRRWQVDSDYLAKLSPYELRWFAQFLGEYYKAAVKKDDPGALHNTEELRKACYAAGNASRRDVSSVGGRQGLGDEAIVPNPEDALIEWLDREQNEDD